MLIANLPVYECSYRETLLHMLLSIHTGSDDQEFVRVQGVSVTLAAG